MFPRSELADAKAYLTGSFPLKMDTYAKIAGMLTSVEIYGLGLDYPKTYPGLINAVTREDIQRVARNTFIRTRWRSWWSRTRKRRS